MNDLAISAEGLHKSYRLGRVDLHVLRGVSFTVRRGEFAAIVGASGSGKSTLLHLVGLLDRPDRGKVALDGLDVSKLSATRRSAIRCTQIGFVFQFYHLLEELTVLENAILPAKVAHSTFGWLARRAELFEQARALLEELGLADRLRHRPRELSGGERQRVAIARALINKPKLLLADEPTGNLDSKTGGHIIELLERLNGQRNQTILMVTHDPAVASRAHRILHLTDGRLSQ